MVVSVLLSMVLKDMVPLLPLCILAVKELLMLLGGLLMLKKGIVVHAEMIGKVAQVVLIAALILCFFTDRIRDAGWPPIQLYVLWTGVVLALCALVFYAVHAWKQLKKK